MYVMARVSSDSEMLGDTEVICDAKFISLIQHFICILFRFWTQMENQFVLGWCVTKGESGEN